MISGKPASDGQPVPCICAFLFDGASDSRFAFFLILFLFSIPGIMAVPVARYFTSILRRIVSYRQIPRVSELTRIVGSHGIFLF